MFGLGIIGSLIGNGIADQRADAQRQIDAAAHQQCIAAHNSRAKYEEALKEQAVVDFVNGLPESIRVEIQLKGLI